MQVHFLAQCSWLRLEFLRNSISIALTNNDDDDNNNNNYYYNKIYVLRSTTVHNLLVLSLDTMHELRDQIVSIG